MLEHTCVHHNVKMKNIERHSSLQMEYLGILGNDWLGSKFSINQMLFNKYVIINCSNCNCIPINILVYVVCYINRGQFVFILFFYESK